MEKTTERKVAETILHQPKRIQIGGKNYRTAKITFASVVEVSAVISEIPDSITSGEENLVITTLKNAKDYDGAPKVIATMMCDTRLMLLGRFGHWMFHRRVSRLSKRLMVSHTPNELNVAAQTLIKDTEIADFFSLSTFLAGINMTKATKVENTENPTMETTASGL